MPNTHKQTISTPNSSRTFASALPRYSAELEMGEAISASKQSFGNSRAKLRFRMRAPANANTIHNKPPEKLRISSEVGSNAKLNSSRITSEKESDALMASLVRSSARRSLAAMRKVRRSRSAIRISPRHKCGTASPDRPASLACGVRCAQFFPAGSWRHRLPAPVLPGADAWTSQLCGLGRALVEARIEHGNGAIVERGERL